MAISTATTTLKYSATSGGTYAKLVDIVTYPDMGSDPSKLDTTTLSAVSMKTFILGLQDSPDLTFECNYDKTAYALIKGLEGDLTYFKLEFGEAGVDGIFSWSGKISIKVSGAGVDEVRKMTLTLSAEAEITFA